MNPYDNQSHHRRSIRLKGYDYSKPGAYFVTVCTHNKVCLFGNIEHDVMKKNEYGRIVINEWLKTGEFRQGIELCEYVLMPNHVHGVLIIHPRDSADGGTTTRTPTIEQFGKPISGSLPTIIRSFKSAVTKAINDLRNTPGLQVWQRNYYEHVIRNEADYNRIAEYVSGNPKQWKEDTLNPDNPNGNRGSTACRGTARRAPTHQTKARIVIFS